MKNIRLLGVLAMVSGLTMASCAGTREVPMVCDAAIPAAESTVTVDTNSNGNTTFDLTVKHLAQPQRVDPNATVYVVWARAGASDQESQNMGALKVDDSLNGSYSGVTALREFELFVTAEPSAAAASPTGRTLLHGNVVAK